MADRSSSSLRRALEAKLTKIGGPGFCNHLKKKALGEAEESQQSSRSSAQDIFSIDADGKSRSRIVKLVTEPRRVKNLALTITIIFLATAFLLVRKRQLVKRLLIAAYRLFSKLGGKLVPLGAK